MLKNEIAIKILLIAKPYYTILGMELHAVNLIKIVRSPSVLHGPSLSRRANKNKSCTGCFLNVTRNIPCK